MQISPDVHDVHDVMYYELDDCFWLMRITNNNIYYYCYRIGSNFLNLKQLGAFPHIFFGISCGFNWGMLYNSLCCGSFGYSREVFSQPL